MEAQLAWYYSVPHITVRSSGPLVNFSQLSDVQSPGSWPPFQDARPDGGGVDG